MERQGPTGTRSGGMPWPTAPRPPLRHLLPQLLEVLRRRHLRRRDRHQFCKLKKRQRRPPPGPDSGPYFSELNKGEAVTKGLRKVDKSEMTHKNPELRAGSTVPDNDSSVRGKSPAPGKKPKPESMRAKKPARKELEGNKWTIVSCALHARYGLVIFPSFPLGRD